RIGSQCLLKRVGGKGRSVLHDGHATDGFFRKEELMASLSSYLLEDCDRFTGNFGPDAVACNHQNLQLHSCYFPLLTLVGCSSRCPPAPEPVQRWTLRAGRPSGRTRPFR